MAYRFFFVTLRNHEQDAEELNRFLRSHRIVNVERNWVSLGTDSFWSFCIDYLETAPSAATGGKLFGDPRAKVDYREVLSPDQFAVFVKLRTLRQSISKEEAVPVYVIFTNEQLAAMIQKNATTKVDLGRIDGVGEARIQKYGDRFLACLMEHRDRENETSGQADGAGTGPGDPT